MTTIETITLGQVYALQAEAETGGDVDTARDCETVIRGYHDADASDLSGAIDELRGEVREAALRLAAVIRDAEGQ